MKRSQSVTYCQYSVAGSVNIIVALASLVVSLRNVYVVNVLFMVSSGSGIAERLASK